MVNVTVRAAPQDCNGGRSTVIGPIAGHGYGPHQQRSNSTPSAEAGARSTRRSPSGFSGESSSRPWRVVPLFMPRRWQSPSCKKFLTRQGQKVRRGELAIEEDSEFHYRIALAADNSIALKVIDVLMDLLRETREKSLQAGDSSRNQWG